MQPIRAALCCVLLALAAPGSADTPRGGANRGDRGDRVPRVGTIPAVENYAPMATGLLEVVSLRAADRVVRVRDKQGKTADVHVQEHVYDLSKLKAGDKIKVDFFQPAEGDTQLRAAGVWPAE